MKWRSPLLAVFLVASLAWMTGCDDPSSVGIDLIGEGTDPRTDTLQVDALTALDRIPVTGNTSRILFGTVDDPVLGEIEAEGYINFARDDDELTSPTSPVDSVFVEFEPDYVYGDSTSTLTLQIFDILSASQWSAQGARSDTSLSVGEVITETTFTPADTLVRIHLPASWIQANENVLTTDPDTFNEDFRGFKLIASRSGTGAVVGAGLQNLRLAIFSQAQRTDAAPTTPITALERMGGGTLPADRALIQDGIGPTEDISIPNSAFYSVDFSVASLPETALNGADMRLFADTTVFSDNTPSNFVRPRPDQLRLVAVDADGSVVFEDDQEQVVAFEAQVFFTNDGQLRFRDPDTNSARSLRRYVQEARLGTLPSSIAGLELRFPTGENTINPVVIHTPAGADATAPRVYVTFTEE